MKWPSTNVVPSEVSLLDDQLDSSSIRLLQAKEQNLERLYPMKQEHLSSHSMSHCHREVPDSSSQSPSCHQHRNTCPILDLARESDREDSLPEPALQWRG
jgi:hypothetical protein